MTNQLTNDDLLDVQEKTTELLETLSNLFEDCDIRVTLAALSTSLCCILCEANRQMGDQQPSDLFFESLINGMKVYGRV